MKDKNVGLKIITSNISADLIKIIKKYRSDSISTIKNDITNNRYVIGCSYSGDYDNFHNLIKCYDDLIESGYYVELYEHERKTTIDFLKNWFDSMTDTRKQTEEDWDEIIEED